MNAKITCVASARSSSGSTKTATCAPPPRTHRQRPFLLPRPIGPSGGASPSTAPRTRAPSERQTLPYVLPHRLIDGLDGLLDLVRLGGRQVNQEVDVEIAQRGLPAAL